MDILWLSTISSLMPQRPGPWTKLQILDSSQTLICNQHLMLDGERKAKSKCAFMDGNCSLRPRIFFWIEVSESVCVYLRQNSLNC